MLKTIRYFAFLGLGLALLAGQPALADNLTVFAAASLKNALDDISAKWKEGNSSAVAASYASSSTLAKQIEQGAPADVFISADQQWMDYVDKKSLVEKPHELLGNRLVLIAAKDNPLTLNIDTVNPVCTKLNSGTAVIRVEGPQAPYSLTFNNATYPSGSLIDQLSNGNYSFPVTNQDGCIVDTAHIHLQLDILPQCSSVYLPNAFSPDGNGANDLFRVIRSSPYLKDITLRVYDRYGMIIFVSSDEKPGWDGTFHGIRQPADTYSWTVDYIDFENKRRSGRGTVILIR